MKKNIAFIVLTLMIFTSLVPVFAQTSSPSQKPDNPRTASKSALMQKKPGNLKQRALSEIDRRVTSLKKLVIRIDSIKGLSSTQKTSLINQVQAEITTLEALKAKIQTNTDPATLKSDIDSIIKGHKNYSFFVPKIHIIISADRMLLTADQASSLSAKLQTRIGEEKAKGEDVTTLESQHASMSAEIISARALAFNAINAVLPLTSSGYPVNKSILQSAREMLRLGHRDLMDAHLLAQRIRQGLHMFGKDKNSLPSVTLTPSKTPTPTP